MPEMYSQGPALLNIQIFLNLQCLRNLHFCDFPSPSLSGCELPPLLLFPLQWCEYSYLEHQAAILQNREREVPLFAPVGFDWLCWSSPVQYTNSSGHLVRWMARPERVNSHADQWMTSPHKQQPTRVIWATWGLRSLDKGTLQFVTQKMLLCR